MPLTVTLFAPLMKTEFCFFLCASITTLSGLRGLPMSRRKAFFLPLIFTPSRYLPFAILIVSPALALFTAFWMVLMQCLPCLHTCSVFVCDGRLLGPPGFDGGG